MCNENRSQKTNASDLDDFTVLPNPGHRQWPLPENLKTNFPFHGKLWEKGKPQRSVPLLRYFIVADFWQSTEFMEDPQLIADAAVCMLFLKYILLDIAANLNPWQHTA